MSACRPISYSCANSCSDIVAEMSTLPPSGISAHQNLIMYPTGVTETFPSAEGQGFSGVDRQYEIDEISMMFYSSQIWLRVLLNEAHNSLYGSKGGSTGFDHHLTREGGMSHVQLLAGWRNMLPAALVWDDEDPPPTDLNQARLRAKYYGGLYMMLRPYLRMATHDPGLVTTPHQSSSTARSSNLSESQREIIKNAHRCIECAIKSTVAFDRVGADKDSPYQNYQSTRTKRLVVTNIFGTLHA